MDADKVTFVSIVMTCDPVYETEKYPALGGVLVVSFSVVNPHRPFQFRVLKRKP